MEKNTHTRASSSSSTADRKTVEKNRRNHMKGLYSELNSLVPRQQVSETSLPEQLDEAATYVKKLQMKVEKMREKKDNLVAQDKPNISIEVHEAGSALQVILVTGTEYHQLVFNEAVRVLHEEGTEVVNANFTVSDHTVFHTIHCQMGGSTSKNGASRITKRLNKLVRDTNAN